MSKTISSPLVKGGLAELTQRIEVSQITTWYKSILNIDVSDYFNGLEEVLVYKCNESGYRFYEPAFVSGDGSFYEQLEQFSWYYMPWKWEHQKTIEMLNGVNSILEVGSGGLGFLERVSKTGTKAVGLELNPSSIEKAISLELDVRNETVETHADNHSEAYDLVASYQVLEHISDVRGFIDGMVRCVVPGGRILIAVPNNSSFIRFDKEPFMNVPPHHMGLWDTTSIKYLENLFPLRCIGIHREPLQTYHVDWYLDIQSRRWLRKTRIGRFAYFQLGLKFILSKLIKMFRARIVGHSMLVEFVKLDNEANYSDEDTNR